MKRFAHRIADVKSNEYPNHIIFFDTETKEHRLASGETQLNLFFGLAAYCRIAKSGRKDTQQWITFRSKRAFWRFVYDHSYEGQRLYLVAHNVTFDFKVTDGFAQMKRKGYKLTKLINAGTRNIWDFRKGKSTIVVLDNMNYFNSSLDALGESVGIPKLKMPAITAPFSEWETYCKRDVEVMIEAWRIWRQFLLDNDLGAFAKTLAAQAFNAYRHRFMPHEIYVHTNNTAVRLERESYHGGRTEAFFIGDLPQAPYYYLDVNSMYPAVMKTELYPTKLIALKTAMSIAELKGLLKSYCVIAKVEINTPENVFSTVYDNRLIFPTGRYITTLTTKELEYALYHNYVLRIISAAVYERKAIFTEYVDFFYTKRMQYKADSNPAFSYCCKLLLNCLYGKFGQRQEVYEKVAEVDDPENKIWSEFDVAADAYKTYRQVNGIVEVNTGFVEGFNSCVAIASHVTANARMKLWAYMQHIGKENVFYCDTDSIFTNQEGYEKAKGLIDNQTLGALGVKGTSEILNIRGAKDYVFGQETVIKGVRRAARKVSENVYVQTRFEGLLGAWRHNRLDTQIISETTKHLSRRYRKGIVGEDGHVQPFKLSR